DAELIRYSATFIHPRICHIHFPPYSSATPLFLFFFSYSGDHRDLHSFPTRRSSDLELRIPIVRGERNLGTSRELMPYPSDRRVRSEEHTSELQSPYDLVCRLLLEKKKKRIKNERANTGT